MRLPAQEDSPCGRLFEIRGRAQCSCKCLVSFFAAFFHRRHCQRRWQLRGAPALARVFRLLSWCVRLLEHCLHDLQWFGGICCTCASRATHPPPHPHRAPGTAHRPPQPNATQPNPTQPSQPNPTPPQLHPNQPNNHCPTQPNPTEPLEEGLNQPTQPFHSQAQGPSRSTGGEKG